MERKVVSAKTPLGESMGYSRAIRVGNQVFVSGTAPIDEKGAVAGKGDVYEQMVYALNKIGDALREVGASLDDVVRTSLYVTDISKLDGIVRAHREFFGKTKPCATLVQVSALVDPDMLVEVEAEAVLAR